MGEDIQQKLSTLTDLAMEANNLAIERTGGEISGIVVDEEKKNEAEITRVNIKDEAAGAKIGKKPGNYITIESDFFRQSDKQIHERLSGVIAQEIKQVINVGPKNNIAEDKTILVIGLGNWNATPDALGPEVIHHLLVTRHLYDSAPIKNRAGMRSVAALSPGVLGLTGIETAEIIKGVVEKINPDLIIAVDALAANDSKKLAATVQISDTGIYPGSGVGKQRIGITKEDMGIPVLAVGIPTVINSVHLIDETIKHLAKENNLLQKSERFNKIEYERLINNTLAPFLGDLVVTPKGIDKLIKDTSKILAGGINIALHPDVKVEDVSLYLQ